MSRVPASLVGVRRFLDPLRPGNPFTLSRLAILPDGTPCPVLLLLAREKFGRYSSSLLPFWLDGNYRNEVLGNVALAERKGLQRKYRRLGLGRSGLGLRGRAYLHAWARMNKERWAEYGRRSDRRAAVRRKLAQALGIRDGRKKA